MFIEIDTDGERRDKQGTEQNQALMTEKPDREVSYSLVSRESKEKGGKYDGG